MSMLLVAFLMISTHTASAQTTQVIYQSDFSSDPNWNTDEPDNFYHQASTSALYAHIENTPPAYTPNRYYEINTTLDPTQSFNLEVDMKILDFDVDGVALFGLYTEELESVDEYRVTGKVSEGTLNMMVRGLNSSLGYWDLNIHDNNQKSKGAGGSGPVASLDVWYEILFEYNAASGTVHMRMQEKDTGVVWKEVTRSDIYFNPEMTHLGISMHPEGEPRTVMSAGDRLAGSSDFLIDNVLLTQEVPEEPESEIDPLLLQYAPILYMHPEEDYFPMNVESFVKDSSLWNQTGSDEQLYSVDDLTFELFETIASTTDTSDYYLAYSDPDTAKSIDLNAARTKYGNAITSGEATTTVYVHRMEDSYTDEQGIEHEFIVLQYWYFYAMNNWAEATDQVLANNHEGDWESVFIFLNKDTEEPKFVAYSAHHNDGINESINPLQYGSVRRDWESDDVAVSDDHVSSYVSLGSHANYPNAEDRNTRIGTDFPSSVGEVMQTGAFSEISDIDSISPVWMLYEGKWGADRVALGGGGSLGPNFTQLLFNSEIRFHDPIQWAGIDQQSTFTIDEPTNSIASTIAQVTMQFTQALAKGTVVTIDPHQEYISFGLNIADIQFLPTYYDFNTSLLNGDFEVQVTLTYTDEELEALELTEDDLTIYYFNTITNVWEEVSSTADANANIVSFTTDHFSVYAIGAPTQMQELTIEELFDQLHTEIANTDLREHHKRNLNRYTNLIERFVSKGNPRSVKVAKRLLKNLERKITHYHRFGTLTDLEKETLLETIDSIQEKL